MAWDGNYKLRGSALSQYIVGLIQSTSKVRKKKITNFFLFISFPSVFLLFWDSSVSTTCCIYQSEVDIFFGYFSLVFPWDFSCNQILSKRAITRFNIMAINIFKILSSFKNKFYLFEIQREPLCLPTSQMPSAGQSWAILKLRSPKPAHVDDRKAVTSASAACWN